jgi:hypothetical protein
MQVDRPRPRRKGLGCLPGLLFILVAGGLFYVAAVAIFDPWIYVVGGRFRPLPLWQGAGEAKGPGGLYRVYVWFGPVPNRQHVLPETSVEGGASICAPNGKRHDVKLSGGTGAVVWRRMDGRPFTLRLTGRPLLGGITKPVVGPPRVTFKGRWSGPNLIMDDQGGLTRAFLPDGSLNPKGAVTGDQAAAPITFAEVGGWPHLDCR